MNSREDDRPYRDNVGICLINQQGLIWMGRTPTSGPEIVTPDQDWQMPQGGVEADEDIAEAAKRELWEETGVTSIELLDVTSEWWSYDFPKGYSPTGHKLDPFKGQRQKWAAYRFTGQDEEVDISADKVGVPQEFFEWRWMTTKQAIDRTVVFKLQQYQRVFRAFDRFLAK